MKSILVYIFVFFPLFGIAQTIKGSVKDSNGNILSFANILIKENENPSSIVEFTYARNGLFTLTLKKNIKLY